MYKNIDHKKIEKRILKSNDFIIERTSQKDLSQQLHFYVEKGINIKYLLIVDEPYDSEMFRGWNLKDGSSLQSYRLFLKNIDNKIYNFQHEIAKQARLNSRSLFIGTSNEKFNLKSVYNFLGLASFGRVNIDAFLTGEAQLNCSADINVLPKAQKSDTRVDMTLRLESDGAEGEIIPGLNIAANDVKAGHSAGTFRLKAEDLFYLRSRGLSVLQIRRLFILSLANSFVAGIEDLKIKEEVLTLITNNL